ncbi:MAG TPA: type II toxin-antitoxin system RelE/ParE family toxin [Pirellulaceae bacterium]|nr:type II toxin-antitoxin system RelE/ParE family toxin [Pirellulaceae bacterium]
MKREVLLLKEAQHDIGQIAQYLEGVSVQATQRFHEALEEVFDQLEAQAEIGQRYDFADGSETGLRFWRLKSFGDYLVCFRIIGDKVWVYRIVHGSRDLTAILGNVS